MYARIVTPSAAAAALLYYTRRDDRLQRAGNAQLYVRARRPKRHNIINIILFFIFRRLSSLPWSLRAQSPATTTTAYVYIYIYTQVGR